MTYGFMVVKPTASLFCL